MVSRFPGVPSLVRACALVASLVAPTARAQELPAESIDDLTMLDLEDLMAIEVETTSVSRSSRPVSESPAAVYVLTAEDVRRSGASTLMDVLRLVPGMQVARIGSNFWAVSARGFNDAFADKLLVLVDGRTVFTPLFNGTFWDVQDLPLEDVERVEVVRGPGGTLWGAHAVNGVVNVITRSSADTQGSLLSVRVGDMDRAIATLRTGGTTPSGATWRTYARALDRDGSTYPDGPDAHDAWHQFRAGFRLDDGTEHGRWMLQGAGYYGRHGLVVPFASTSSPPVAPTDFDAELAGGHVQGRWTRTEPDSTITLQTYHDVTYRRYELLTETRNTLDLDFQHELRAAGPHRLVWGLGYRVHLVDLRDSRPLAFDPEERTDHLVSGFLQDEIHLPADWFLTLGTKLEVNSSTGLEVQPTARLLRSFAGGHTVWAAASRAVNTPSQVFQDVAFLRQVVPGAGSNTLVTTVGNPDLGSESLMAYELGYRSLLTPDLSVDVAVFHHDYDDTFVSVPGTPFPLGPDTVLPLDIENGGTAESYGLEVAAEWRATPRWTLNAAYTRLETDADPDPGAMNTQMAQDPAHQLHLRSDHDLTETLELSLLADWVDDLSESGVDGYVRADANLQWRARPGIDLTVGVQGLFHDGELEFGPTPLPTGSETETTFFLQLTLTR